MESKALGATALFVTLIVLASGLHYASGVSAAPAVVDRTFYLSSNTLVFAQPQGGVSTVANFTKTPIEFTIQNPLFNTVTLSGPIFFSLWLSSNKTTEVPLKASIGGAFNVTTQVIREPLTSTPHNVTFSYTPNSNLPLLFGAPISLAIFAPPPNRTSVTLYWGSRSNSSFVVLPLSGYDLVNSVTTQDQSQHTTTDFSLNASIGKNVVLIQTSITAAFGFQDIQKVNLTIVDPNLNPVKRAHSQNMSGPFPQSQYPPYYFNFVWAYPLNSTQGSYQVYIDIFDVQSHLAFSFRGPASFSLSRPSIFSSPPFSLLPYVGVAGVAAAGGVFYYRRRQAKSYLAPFEHFNTLAGGTLDGGTVVAVEGNTGAGKTLLSEQLMYEDLKKGTPCIFVATGDFPANVRANMKSMGLDTTGYEQNGLLTFVDGYSAEAGQESKEKFSVPSLNDLTTLGMKITSSLPPDSAKGASLYFDSLTPLATKAKPESIVPFVQSVGARMRGLGGKALFTLGPSIEGRVQRQLEEMADCVVQMEAFEEQGLRRRRLRITKVRARSHQEGWAIFAIEDGKGIIFYSRKPSK